MNNKCFVSMPFGDNPESPENEWTKLYDFGLKPLESKIVDLPEGFTHTPIKLHRADRDLEGLALKENVIRGIDLSTFALCVLTTQIVDGSHGLRLSNPNVLWELGHAEALGKPIVILADKADLQQLPILAGLRNICIYNHTIVREVEVKDAPDALKPIARKLIPYIKQAIEDSRRTRVGVQGLARFYPIRDGSYLREMIASAKQQVDILTTNISYFKSKEFLNDYENPFKIALENEATVRIVTMDPESVIAEYRAKQLVKGQDVPGYREELRNSIIWFYNKFGDRPNFHLHIYNDLPLQITMRVDSAIVTSIVTRGERARRRIQIQFNLYDEGVTESFVSHFQSMFDNSDDVAGFKWVTREGSRQTNAQKSTKKGGQTDDLVLG